jgi:predicted adenylyl cyclase CyaB
MARNVELKARIANVESVLASVAACADGPPELIAQDDTFFACSHGRLKLRAFPDGSGQFIAYERPDASGPKTSDYAIAPVTDPDTLRNTLARALGIGGRVVKRRQLLMIGPTRVHLDRVEGLGDFLELEVVLRDDQHADEGVAIAHALLARLGIDASQLISGAYVDLLRAAPEPAKPTPLSADRA